MRIQNRNGVYIVRKNTRNAQKGLQKREKMCTFAAHYGQKTPVS